MVRVLKVRVSNAGRRFTDFVRKYLSRESGALYRTRLLANCAEGKRPAPVPSSPPLPVPSSAKLANFAKFLQIFSGLVLGCIKTKFCKKIIKICV